MCFTTLVTDRQGKVVYCIPEEKRLTEGMYPVKFVVRYVVCVCSHCVHTCGQLCPTSIDEGMSANVTRGVHSLSVIELRTCGVSCAPETGVIVDNLSNGQIIAAFEMGQFKGLLPEYPGVSNASIAIPLHSQCTSGASGRNLAVTVYLD